LRAIAVGCLLSSPIWLWTLFFSADQDGYAPSLIFVPLIVLVCSVAFIPLWRGNPYLKQLLSVGILARLVAVSLYVWIGVFVYDTSVDAFHYWYVGMQRANDFSMIGWSAFPPPFWNTNLVNNICAFVMLAIGNTLPGLFVLFALAALWGGYLFYRAFCIAFPKGETQLYGLLALLLPSNLFWSSAIGKDALAQLFIGLTVFGFSKACCNLDLRSIVTCVAGLGGVLAVRPHIAAMLAVAVTLPFALARTNGGSIKVAKKIVFIPLLISLSLFVINQAGQFVGVETTDTQSGIETIDRLTKSTQIGGSAFNSEQSLVLRMAEAPFLIFRPFPWEAHNGMAVVASLEALGLLWFAWKRRRVLKAALWHWREPFVGFVLAYSIIFSFAFAAATSNFGILVRERIMMVPLLLMLLCSGLKKPQAQPGASNRKFAFIGTQAATYGKPKLS
jgi:hypothetical protein